jgi:hypothetical protein
LPAEEDAHRLRSFVIEIAIWPDVLFPWSGHASSEA